MVNGVFLYIHGAAYVEETIAALRNFGLDIRTREIKANSEVISNLVPNALQRAAESWLILHLPDRQQELIILPFPDRNYLQRLRYPENFHGYLADLIPSVEGYLKLTHENFYIPPDFIGRFQYIRHGSVLDSLLPEVSNVPGSEAESQIQSKLLRTSQSIQQQRSEILSEVLRRLGGQPVPDRVFIDRLVNTLDEAFVVKNDEIFQYLKTTHGAIEVVPPIVRDFEDVIHKETKKFLITSETVRKFADDYSPSNFDYSAPGCGFWKAVERELNLSLVLYLRQQKNIANIDIPRRGIISPRIKVRIQTGDDYSVNLNERERKGSGILSDLMLGPMMHMLRWCTINGIRKDLEDLGLTDDMLSYLLGRNHQARSPLPRTSVDTLPWHLRKLITLRNGHAHTSAMSRRQFNKLRNLVLPSSSNPETCLIKILQLKRKVFGL